MSAGPMSYDFVVVTNRLPVDAGPDATEPSLAPVGIARSLHATVRERTGAWIGWSGQAGAAGGTEHEGVWLQPVQLSAAEIDDYHNGASNATLWPLYHDAVGQPAFRRRWREAYHQINHRYAETVAQLAAPGAMVWIHDYQLQLVPAMVRSMRPDLRIGFFLHTPFPAVELFCQLPQRDEIVRGLLGADLIGFQSPLAVRNFLRVADHLHGLRPRGHTIDHDGRRVTVGAFPASVDVGDVERSAARPAILSAASALRTELGDARTVIVGTDGPGSASGRLERLRAVAELLVQGRLDPALTVFVEVGFDGRSGIDNADAIDRLVRHINAEHAGVGRPVVHHWDRAPARDDLIALYLSADVMVVTPLRDGMNLVAKEYVAARRDGALVLSEFAGAADEMHHAFLVNPRDMEQTKEAIMAAVTATPGDRLKRMRAMQRHVRRHDASAWCAGFLSDLTLTRGSFTATLKLPRQRDRSVGVHTK